MNGAGANGERKRGMTLIEVLMAIAILGLALVMMLTAISRSLAVLRVADRYHKAMWALSMGTAEYPDMLPPDGEPEDLVVRDAEYDGIRFSRTVDDPDQDAPDAELRLIRLTTTLAWEGRGRDQFMRIPYYMYYQESP